MELPWGIAADRIGYRRSKIACCGFYLLLYREAMQMVLTCGRATQLSIYAVLEDMIAAGTDLAYGKAADVSPVGGYPDH